GCAHPSRSTSPPAVVSAPPCSPTRGSSPAGWQMNSQWLVAPPLQEAASVNLVFPAVARHWSAGRVITAVSRVSSTKLTVSLTAGQVLGAFGVTVSLAQ